MAIDINIPSQVKTYANLAGFPATGSLNTIFIAEDTNKTYRWTGSAYVEISASQATAWGAITGTISNQTDLQTALNAKQNILGFTAVPTSRTLTINGTTQDLSADRTFTISTGITIGTTAITSGTVGRVLFEGTGNVVSESANLFWDNTNGRLGIGTSSPTVAIDVVGAGKFSTTLEVTSTAGITLGGGAKSLSWTGTILELGNSATWTDVRLFASGVQKFSQTSTLTTISNTTINLSTANVQLAGVNALAYSGADVRIGSITAGFTSLSFYTSATEKMRIAPTTGNVLINTTTDAGFKLDVNGTARVSGTFQVNQSNQVIGDVSFQSGAGGGILRLLATSAGKASGSFYYDGSDVSNSAYGAFGIATSGTYFGVTGSVLFASSKNGTGTQLPMSFGGYNGSWTNWMQIKTNGNVLINTTTDVTSSKLTIESTTQGFLPPRMTTTQKNAIATPATGLMVYDTTLNLISVYNGTTWITL